MNHIDPAKSALPVGAGRSISDEELVADLFRLARSERFQKAEPLLAEAQAMHPNEPPERIMACLRRLGEILWDTDHGGYATEYTRHRRPNGSGLKGTAWRFRANSHAGHYQSRRA